MATKNSNFKFFKKPEDSFSFINLFKLGSKISSSEKINDEVVKVYSLYPSFVSADEVITDSNFLEQPVGRLKQTLYTQIVKNYLFALFVVYKQFYFIFKKKIINEDVVLVMNKLSLVGLLFSLMLLGVIFFLAGFLVSANISSPNISTRDGHTHEPSQEALINGVSPQASKMPNAHKLMPNKYKNPNDTIMYGTKRMPTQMKKNNSKPSHYANNNYVRHSPSQYSGNNYVPGTNRQNYYRNNYQPQQSSNFYNR